MEPLLERIIQNGWVVLISKNTVGWVVQLKHAVTGEIKNELQHTDLEELLNELSLYKRAEQTKYQYP